MHLVFWFNFIFIACFSYTFSPSVDPTMSDFFRTILHQWTCAEHNKKKSRNTKFRGKLFSLGFFFWRSVCWCYCRCCSGAPSFVWESFAYAVIACISISLVHNHALAFAAYAEKYFDMLQIYCSLGIISCWTLLFFIPKMMRPLFPSSSINLK